MKLIVELEAHLEGLNEEFHGKYVKAIIEEGARKLNIKTFVHRIKKPDARINRVEYKGKTLFETAEWKK